MATQSADVGDDIENPGHGLGCERVPQERIRMYAIDEIRSPPSELLPLETHISRIGFQSAARHPNEREKKKQERKHWRPNVSYHRAVGDSCPCLPLPDAVQPLLSGSLSLSLSIPRFFRLSPALSFLVTSTRVLTFRLAGNLLTLSSIE